MSGFSAAWLSLREPVDARSRNAALLAQFSSRLEHKSELSFVDLGCGTGSNLRAMALSFPASTKQRWLLCDLDPALLDAAKHALSEWADAVSLTSDALTLEKHGRKLQVRFRQTDLTGDLDGLFSTGDIVTASAFFDLVSQEWIDRFVKAVSNVKALVFTVLTYNGVETWMPPHAADLPVLAAFHAHQKTDKGFGRAAGPTAAAELAKALGKNGYIVATGSSDWVLEEQDRPLIMQLAEGSAHAVGELGVFDSAILEDWKNSRRNAVKCAIGHIDLIAWPDSCDDPKPAL